MLKSAQIEAAFSTDDTKDPSIKATLMGRKFYSDVWMNEKKKLSEPKKLAERARRIGIIIEFLFRCLFSVFGLTICLLQLNFHRYLSRTTPRPIPL
jgi:hypothetical protein